MSDRANVNLTA